MSFAVRILSIAIALPALLAARANAQSVTRDSSSAQVAPPSQADSTPPWITRRELEWLGGSVIATVAVAPLDRPVAGEMGESDWKRDERLRSASQVLAFTGGPGPFFLGAGMFAAGELGGSSQVAGAGERVTESVLLAATLTGIGKGIAGRALPGVKTSEEFQWGRGFHSGNGPFVSFPSGHTAAAFAMAAALTGEAGTWRNGLDSYVGPAAYGTATAVALSRVYERVHWMSDLPLAAAIGTWSGLSVESHSHHTRHLSAIRSIAAATTVARAAGGKTLVGWTLPLPEQTR
jgi:membrane-associated phospholipid phosphatase